MKDTAGSDQADPGSGDPGGRWSHQASDVRDLKRREAGGVRGASKEFFSHEFCGTFVQPISMKI